MQQLWAPWRMEFIGAERQEGCIFCRFPAESEERDRGNLLLARYGSAFAILNRYPYNNGHLMVIPRRHTAEFAQLSAEEHASLSTLLKIAVEALGVTYHPEGFNIGMNLGRIAGAGIADHLHYHVVPRWGGDTNFMPVLGETKVMIEHLDTSFVRLREEFDRRLASR